MAPFVPYLSDALWENLVVAVDPAAPDSVHLSDFPTATGRANADVDRAVALARRVVAQGRTARAASAVRTRQPLPRLRARLPGGAGAFAAESAVSAELEGHIRDELNVKAVELLTDDADLVDRALYPLLPVIGPRHGQDVPRVMAAVQAGDWRILEDGTAQAGGVALAADEFEVTSRAHPGHEIAVDGDLLVALDTAIDEGLGRRRAWPARSPIESRACASRRAWPSTIESWLPIGGDRHRSWPSSNPIGDGSPRRRSPVELTLGEAADLVDAAGREDVDLDGVALHLALRRAE